MGRCAVEVELIERGVELCDVFWSQGDVGRREVLFHALYAARAGDGHDPRLFVDHPAEANLCHRRILFLCHGADEVERLLIVGEAFRRELEAAAAVIFRVVEGGTLCVAAGEEAFCKRRVCDERDAELLKNGEEVFGLAVDGVIHILHGRNGADGVCAAQVIFCDAGDAPRTDFALFFELRHGLGYNFRLRFGVDAVLIVKVDVIGLQALEAAFDRLADGGGAAVEQHFVIAELYAALCGEDKLIADALDAEADGFFIVGGGAVRVCTGVALGGIEESVAHLKRGLDFVCGIGFFERCAERVGKPHAAETDRRYFNVGVA